MIEVIVTDYLSGRMDVPVSCEYPEDLPGSEAPERFVVIEKTGSGETNHLKEATMAIQSVGPTLYDAMELNDQIKNAMADIIELPVIASCRLNSDYNFTNTATKQYRYQAVFDIAHY